MSTVRVCVSIDTRPSVDIEGTVGSLELMEFLYHNEANIPDIKPVSIKPVSTLTLSICSIRA